MGADGTTPLCLWLLNVFENELQDFRSLSRDWTPASFEDTRNHALGVPDASRTDAQKVVLNTKVLDHSKGVRDWNARLSRSGVVVAIVLDSDGGARSTAMPQHVDLVVSATNANTEVPEEFGDVGRCELFRNDRFDNVCRVRGILDGVHPGADVRVAVETLDAAGSRTEVSPSFFSWYRPRSGVALDYNLVLVGAAWQRPGSEHAPDAVVIPATIGFNYRRFFRTRDVRGLGYFYAGAATGPMLVFPRKDVQAAEDGEAPSAGLNGWALAGTVGLAGVEVGVGVGIDWSPELSNSRRATLLFTTSITKLLGGLLGTNDGKASAIRSWADVGG